MKQLFLKCSTQEKRPESQALFTQSSYETKLKKYMYRPYLLLLFIFIFTIIINHYYSHLLHSLRWNNCPHYFYGFMSPNPQPYSLAKTLHLPSFIYQLYLSWKKKKSSLSAFYSLKLWKVRNNLEDKNSIFKEMSRTFQ